MNIEGDECPFADCNGVMFFPQSKDCICNICAPCNACTNSILVCSECGYQAGDEDDLCSPEDTSFNNILGGISNV